MENQEKLNLNLYPDTNEVVIRHGVALPVREPIPLNIVGSITSPSAFYNKRHELIDKQKAHVTFSKKTREIILNINERDYFCDTITGRLIINPDLVDFSVNTKTYRTPKDLAQFLKMRKHLFAKKEQNMDVVTALNTMTAKVETDLEQKQDIKGNERKLIDKKVTSNIQLEFVLTMPIFVGQPACTFRIEIGTDATDSTIRVYLESQELEELIVTEGGKLIDAEVTLFEDDLVVIEH